jgi:phosphonate transport system substrate-binding protein
MAEVCFRGGNRNDATAAYRVFLENQGRHIGRIYKADPQVFDSMPKFEAAIKEQPIHMAVMESWQFLAMDIHQQMRPFFTIMENGQVGRRYLILMRRDSGLTTLADLRGKSILEIDVANAYVGKAWLDTLLMSEGLGIREKFFGSVEMVSKPTAAVLPVFFGKTPACVVDQPSFDVMKELNPQVGEQLQVLAVSDKFSDVVICLREDGWITDKDKSDTIESLNDLHLDPIGQQICTLFKIDRMVPFQDSQLDTIRKLQTTYESLRKENAR